MNETQMNAYALGYFDGRAHGFENPKTVMHFSYVECYFYKQGYERGVSDYSEFDAENDAQEVA